jgi:succinate dehydrogenase/fumarate reductase flavoprotein subunit
LKDAALASAAVAAGSIIPQSTASAQVPATWDQTADVIVIGSGGAGLPAAIAAVEAGASVIVVEANYDVGGHAITSGGNTPIGGGHSHQKKFGIEDSPDLLFKDLVDWSVIEPNGSSNYTYNDRELMRAAADNSAPTFEFLVANGIKFNDIPSDNSGGHSVGNSVPREHHVSWGKGASLESPVGAAGIAWIRPLEDSARKKGVKFLLNYKMTGIIREKPLAGRVLGVTAQYNPLILPGQTTPLKSFRSDGNIDITTKTVNLKANKAVIIATGGSASNVNFRRMFDPRQTEEYPVGGEPYSYQDASGELAGMAIGASLWGLTHQALENGGGFRQRPTMGCKYNYSKWPKESPIFPLFKATGLSIRDWQDVVLVSQVGKRFYDETLGNTPEGNVSGEIKDYVHGSWRNLLQPQWDPRRWNFLNAATAINENSAPPNFSAGPTWAIFDSAAVAREKWDVKPPNVDPDGYFFTANTIAELAAAIKNPYMKKPLDPKVLEETVARYNSFVEKGKDEDFEKPTPKYKIEKPPFYAAWNTPVVHDTRAGLRINGKGQVVDINGQVIPGLYSGGECAGGWNQHGLGRCAVQGYIAGKNAGAEKPQV